MITSLIKEDQKPDLSWEGSDFDEAWEDFLWEVTYLMRNRDRRSAHWHCEVENFGWQERNGSTTFGALTGSELLMHVLPNTQCTFYIYVVDSTILIQNFHHDSPTGKEWYRLTPIKKDLS